MHATIWINVRLRKIFGGTTFTSSMQIAEWQKTATESLVGPWWDNLYQRYAEWQKIITVGMTSWTSQPTSHDRISSKLAKNIESSELQCPKQFWKMILLKNHNCFVADNLHINMSALENMSVSGTIMLCMTCIFSYCHHLYGIKIENSRIGCVQGYQRYMYLSIKCFTYCGEHLHLSP